ncbi:MAG: efflux transporter periplasmic adaptor subunit [Flavobacteriales bacterium]|nr:MAG: efflux transporter periplasmic adaptor subunit [Flavobacteriales bacterium]
MKKILIPILVLASLASCKKETKPNDNKDISLETLIKNNDVKGLKAYKENQKLKIDSLTKSLSKVNEKLNELGVSSLKEGFVKIQKLEPSSFAHTIDLQGNVKTDEDVTITPQFNGVLTLFVKEGQRVSRGQVLGRIDDGGLQDKLKQAQIQVSAVKSQLEQVKSRANLAKITYQKQAKLWQQKIGSEFQYLQAKTAYEASKMQVRATESQVRATQKSVDYVKASLAKTTIRAPFSGVVDEVITQNGQVVGPGTRIVKLVALGMMKVEANVPEIYLANIKKGTPVKVILPTINKTINTSVRLVGNYINPQNRTFNIQIPIRNEDGIVKPNLLAKLEIQDYVNPSAIQVENQYVYEDAEHKNYVFVAENINGKKAVAKKVFVGIGEKSANTVEISTGLQSGDFIITDGSKSLVNGQKVKID